MLLFMLSVSVKSDRCICDLALTLSSSGQLRGPSVAQIHADDVRRIHGVSQVQTGRNGEAG